jgi:putative ABC transport system permease protein
MIGLAEATLLQGFALALLVLGLAISFRFLDFPDLTIDGSFVLGAATGAHAIRIGVPVTVAVLLAVIAGFVAGCCTGILHSRFRMSKLLSGILMMIALYSINFRVMGASNLSLLQNKTLPDYFSKFLGLGTLGIIIFFGVCAVLAKLSLDFFLKSEWGSVLRTVGDNEILARSLGFSTNRMKILGLGLANGLVAFSGTLVSQYQGFADISMGVGMIVVGVASLIMGEAILQTMPRKLRGSSMVEQRTTAALIGALVYQLIVNVTLRLGIAPTDLKLITALLVIIAVLVGRSRGYAFAGIDRY